jgi:integrase
VRGSGHFGYGAIYRRKTKDGRNRWYLDYKDANGKRVQRVVSDALMPEDAARALREAIQKERFQNVCPGSIPQTVSFEDFAELFYQSHIVANLKRPSTERLRLMVLVEFFKGQELKSITPMMLERFRYERLKAGNAKTTVNRYLALMKKLYNVAINEGAATDNPARKIKFYSEAESQKEHILARDEEERLLEAAPAHLRPILIIALNTGMRWGEIVSLTWKNVDFQAGLIHVVKSKSGKPRVVNINSTLLDMLTALRAQSNGSPYVLPSKVTGEPYASLYRCFIKACKAVGITGLRFHDLRHTFATRLIQGGADIETVRSLLGHHSIVMTQRYTHSSHEMKQRAVEILAQKQPGPGPKTGAICDTAVTREPNRASDEPAEIPLTSSRSVS